MTLSFGQEPDYEKLDLRREVAELKDKCSQLKRIIQCKDNPSKCPCGGNMGDYNSHALDCREISENGKNYWLTD